MLFKIFYIDPVKKLVEHLTILVVWEIAVVSEVWRISVNYGKFYSLLGMAINVSKVSKLLAG